MIIEVHCTGTLDEPFLRFWLQNFKKAVDNVHDKKQLGHPSVIADDQNGSEHPYIVPT